MNDQNENDNIVEDFIIEPEEEDGENVYTENKLFIFFRMRTYMTKLINKLQTSKRS